MIGSILAELIALIKNNGVSVAIGIVYAMIVTALITMIWATYKLKGEYDYGAGLQQACAPIFMEKERGEHTAYIAYRDVVYTQIEKTYIYVLSICVFLIMVAYTLWLIGIIVKCMKSKDLTFYNFITNMNCAISNKGFICGVPFALILLMVSLIITWIGGSFSNMYDSNLSTFAKFSFTALKSAALNNTQNIKEPQKETTDTDRRLILANSQGIIHAIFIVIISGMLIYNPVIDGQPAVTHSMLSHLIVIYIIIATAMPLLTNMIIDIQNTMGYDYVKYKDDLNTTVDALIKGGDTRLQAELEKNFYNSDPISKTFSKNLDVTQKLLHFIEREGDMYKYLIHVINNYDIVSIQIPQELKSILNPTYLSGDNILELKRALSDVYNKLNGALLTYNNIDASLLPYLNTSARKDISDKRASSVLSLLNTHVVTNTAFKKSNPLPMDIITKMNARRKNTAVKDVIDKNFRIINNVFTFFLIAIAYYVYHYHIYSYDIEMKVQFVALVACVLILLMGIIGWGTKEVWL